MGKVTSELQMPFLIQKLIYDNLKDNLVVNNANLPSTYLQKPIYDNLAVNNWPMQTYLQPTFNNPFMTILWWTTDQCKPTLAKFRASCRHQRHIHRPRELCLNGSHLGGTQPGGGWLVDCDNDDNCDDGEDEDDSEDDDDDDNDDDDDDKADDRMRVFLSRVN